RVAWRSIMSLHWGTHPGTHGRLHTFDDRTKEAGRRASLPPVGAKNNQVLRQLWQDLWQRLKSLHILHEVWQESGKGLPQGLKAFLHGFTRCAISSRLKIDRARNQ